MGQYWRPNKAISTDLIVEILKIVAVTIDAAGSNKDRELWKVFVAYLCTTYVLSLRGVEGLLVELFGMSDNKTRWTDRYFIVALLGEVKGEHR